MKKLALSGALLVGALALTGCTSGVEVAPGPPRAQAAATMSEGLSQKWADTQINHFLNGFGAASFRGFLEGTPHRNIDSWSSPEEGVLLVVLSSNIWEEKYLGQLAWDMMSKAGWEDPSVKMVRVTTYDGTEWSDCFRADSRRTLLIDLLGSIPHSE